MFLQLSESNAHVLTNLLIDRSEELMLIIGNPEFSDDERARAADEQDQIIDTLSLLTSGYKTMYSLREEVIDEENPYCEDE